MIEFFKYLFKPSFWMQIYPTNLIWDKKLNELLDKNEPKMITEHTCNIAGIQIWVSNYPYAYGSIYRMGNTVLPKRSTRERLFKQVLLSQIENSRQK